MKELEKRLLELEAEFLAVYEKLEIDKKLEELRKLEAEVAEPEIYPKR